MTAATNAVTYSGGLPLSSDQIIAIIIGGSLALIMAVAAVVLLYTGRWKRSHEINQRVAQMHADRRARRRTVVAGQGAEQTTNEQHSAIELEENAPMKERSNRWA